MIPGTNAGHSDLSTMFIGEYRIVCAWFCGSRGVGSMNCAFAVLSKHKEVWITRSGD
jgi:heme/copper-type cytochrome/quinol oxidase subunit 2